MYKQCLFAKKTEGNLMRSTVSFTMFKRLFAKPLLIIGMENALALLEERRDLSS